MIRRPKKWYRSRQLWLNLSVVCLTLPELLRQSDLLTPEQMAAAAFAFAVVNILLRLFTNQPIEGSPGDKP